MDAAQEEMKGGRNGGYGSSIANRGRGVEENERLEDFDDGNLQSLVEWLNHMVPHLNLPLEASEDELRACLIDGTVLCSILHKLNPGSVDMRGNTEPGPEKLRRFLAAMDDLGLPRFVLADIQQGYMVPVLQCLGTLKAHFDSIGGKQSKLNHSRRLWNLLLANTKGMHKHENASAFEASADVLNVAGLDQLFNGSHGDISDLLKLNGLDDVSTRMLFNLVNKVLDASIERKNGYVQHMAHIVKKVVKVIEQRFSSQAENLKDQKKIYNVHTEKSQSKIRALETLASGTTGEVEVLFTQLQQIKIQKTNIEQKEKLEELDLVRLKEEKNNWDSEKLKLQQELEFAKKTHEEHCLLLVAEAKETKIELEKRIKELELLLLDSRSKVEDLESFSESKSKRWRKKEGTYHNFIDHQSRALQELRVASNCMKREVLKEKRKLFEDFHCMGVKLKGLADAAEHYHWVLAENRRLYNEVQDLKGNIRVYCRIRPFLPGQCKKQTTIEYIGENGELVVSNPSKQGKDSRRVFKFNKVFGQAAGQEEVFLDTQPLIRSVLDGFNVCIFAYGQTGSGKTYTMSGPTLTSKEDWGVNYRALHDLFQITEDRKSSIRYEVGVQMVEIYNEQVRDLLSSDGPHKRLGIWNITQPNGLAVPDASMQSVKSTTDVLELMNIGLMNRAIGATALNERSSRSHSVLTVHVRGTDLETGAVLRGNLHLIDLAGSERVERTEATGDRLREAQHINKSLSALGDVIFALAQKSPHVPYRNSKLTQVLQSSLGGQAKTLMFVQLNPDVDSYWETVSTLKFAERVSGIELGAAKSNKEGKDIRELMQQMSSLKDTITKKDEEIERLHLLKSNVNGMKSGATSLRGDSNSPKKHSGGSPHQVSKKIATGGKGLEPIGKGSSDTENSSDFSEKRSEADSTQSMDEFRYKKGFIPYSKSAGDLELKREVLPQTTVKKDGGHNPKEDNDILGFEEGDSDERLSDISDGGLSMGTETESVEFSLFPEAAKLSETVKPNEAPESVKSHEIARPVEVTKPAQKAESPEKARFTSKLPRPPKRVGPTRPSRLSITKNTSSPRASLSTPRKNMFASASATKSSSRWQ